MIGDIYTAKEQQQGFQPLLLCEFTLVDGSTVRASTHPLDGTHGGPQYAGSSWYPRVLNQDMGATQAMTDIGIDVSPQVQVVLADPDGALSTIEQNIGFKGAKLKIYAVMYDANSPGTGSFSSNSPAPIKFVGTCQSPVFDESSLTVTAVSLLNMSSMQMPPVAVQPFCGWSFPPDYDGRSAAISSPDSLYYQCAYSPDITGGVGNYATGTSCYTSCPHAFGDCIDRLGNSSAAVPIAQDHASRKTGRFGGFQFIPVQNVGLVRPYVTGKWEQLINATNQAKYGDYVPMVYGDTWLQPEVMGVYGDGNYTYLEVALCYGLVSYIAEVVVNGVVVPWISADSGNQPDNFIMSAIVTNSPKNGYWYTINNGQRNGKPNPGTGWNSKGDPYGSIATIGIMVTQQQAASSSVPDVLIRLTGSSVRTYSTPTSWADDAVTQNPAWILLDVLVWANWKYADIDIQSFITAAARCDRQIYFMRMDGTYSNVYNDADSTPYAKYSAAFSLRTRSSVGELIRGLRTAMGANLYFDYNTGLLKLIVKETIASQQPAPITGSNYNLPVPSYLVDGTPQNGYVAYHFDDASIVRDENSGASTLSITQKQGMDAPNKVSVVFGNRENSYSQDSSTIVDVEDSGRLGQEVSGSFQVVGATTYDQIQRAVNLYYAENYRGNGRLSMTGSAIGDTGGTWCFTFKTSVKGLHLGVGQICLLSSTQYGLVNVPIRLTRIQPGANYETVTITAQWHNDNWYLDTFGQSTQLRYPPNYLLGRKRPLQWSPALVTPNSSLTGGRQTFGVTTSYQPAADGSQRVVTGVSGYPPATQTSATTMAPVLNFATVGSGGSLQGGHAYMLCVVGIDASGNPTAPSNAEWVTLPAGSGYSVSLNVSWADGTVSGALYAASAETPDCWDVQIVGLSIASSSSRRTPWNRVNTYTWSVLGPPYSGSDNLYSSGLPDPLCKNLSLEYQDILLGGVATVTVDSLSGSGDRTINLRGTPGFSSNQFLGHVTSLYYQGTPGPNGQDVVDFVISSNGAASLVADRDLTVVTGGITRHYLSPGDVLQIRSKPAGTSAWGWSDANFVNALRPAGLPVDNYIGCVAKVVGGAGIDQEAIIGGNTSTAVEFAAPLLVPLDSTSLVIILDSTVSAPQEINVVGNAVSYPSRLLGWMELPNAKGPIFLRAVATNDAGGFTLDAPARELYFIGAGSANAAPANPTLVVASDHSSERVTSPTGDLLTPTYVSVTLPSGSTATFLELWLHKPSFTQGDGWASIGKFAVGNTPVFWEDVPTATESWSVRVTTGNQYGSNAPSSGTVSSNYSVSSYTQPLAGDITNAAVSAVSSYRNGDGVAMWKMLLTFQLNNTPTAWFANLTVQWYDVTTGLSTDAEQLVGSDVLPGSKTYNVDHWGVIPNTKFRMRLYADARHAPSYVETPGVIPWVDSVDPTQSWVLMHCWPGGADHYDVTPSAPSGSVTAGSLLSSAAAADSGLIVDAGQLKAVVDGVSIYKGSGGALTVLFDGSSIDLGPDGLYIKQIATDRLVAGTALISGALIDALEVRQITGWDGAIIDVGTGLTIDGPLGLSGFLQANGGCIINSDLNLNGLMLGNSGGHLSVGYATLGSMAFLSAGDTQDATYIWDVTQPPATLHFVNGIFTGIT